MSTGVKILIGLGVLALIALSIWFAKKNPKVADEVAAGVDAAGNAIKDGVKKVSEK